MNANTLLPVCDGLVGEIQELGATPAHLDGDVAQSGSVKFQTGRLAMIRAADRLQFSRCALLKFLY